MKTEFKQRRSLFMRNVLAFGLIFLLLGFIVNQVLYQSLYTNIDEELRSVSTNTNFIEQELIKGDASKGDIPKFSGELKPHRDLKPPNSFQVQPILWSASGKIINQEALGNRYSDMANLTFDKEKLDQIEAVHVKDSYNQTINFRSITKKVDSGGVAYIQFVSNTNQLEESMTFFQQVLIGCMIVFWILSIVVSYYLAKLNMAPIMASWKRQQEFVENSSHELRTPLTIIQAKLEKLFTKPTHTILEESEDIALALNETRRLNQLTNDLLLLARSDSNELVVDRKLSDVKDFLIKASEPYQEIAESQQKKMTLELGHLQAVSFDAKLLTQLLIILLDNALKYTGPGETITVFSETTAKYWLIEVRDTGIGLKTTNTDQLFTRFYREDGARQRKTGGYGLGLSIAKSIVDMHHGKISVKANQPKGTIFSVILPLA
ncbi:HAMP domain-containing sensor histidine kinase [uncultured Vagococcus sp.]|uniref:sensor histidine kinase n=1 Tax=uncultured Vagococcus sp. TaxID=189676 RepID=UPI0028D5FD18|nr:HAMP domain-containing sensor histidine kinase [uncultured Vagococcus sp.]